MKKADVSPEKKTLTLQQTLDLAVQHHTAGRLTEAEDIYRQILATDPNQVDAVHLLGVISYQEGKNDRAVNLITKALSIKPDFAEAHYNHGNVLLNLGRLDEAMVSYHKALAIKPDHAEAHNNLGNVLLELGKLEEAVASYHKALAIKSDYVEVLNNLGNALKDLGKWDEAITSYRKALAIKSDYTEAHYNLGSALQDLANLDEAVVHFHKALAIKPDFAEAHNNLGNALKDLGKWDEAITSYRKALAIKSGYTEAHNNLGNVLLDLGKLDEALACYHKALAIKPDYAEAHNNLGGALRKLGKPDEAVASHHKAITIKPDYVDAYWNRGMARLLTGDLLGGFEDYEWRWQLPEFLARHKNIPLWEGQSLAGKSILVCSEQGYGDTIQFIRYAPMLADQGAYVLLEIDEPLKRLLEIVDGVEQVVVGGVSPVSADFRVPIMSLPHRFNTTLDRIPANVPYVPLPPASAVNFDSVAKYTIGIAWAGRSTHKNDANRSLEFTILKPLLDLTDIAWISLQIDDRHNEAAILAKENFFDIRGQIRDFADTGTAIAALDLVITVDTAVAHLAGALGKPVWILLPFAPDWRWLLKRDDSPWYPTMKLFRQQMPGDWEGVINRVVEALLSSEYNWNKKLTLT